MTERVSTEPKSNTSIYLQLGGEAAVHRLVDRFYELMEGLSEARTVRQMHPPSLVGSADSLFKFLSGWFGGPPLFHQERGHPRLRMRHAPFAVSVVERDEWMLCMHQAINEQVDDPSLNAKLQRMFSEMADHMINTDGAAQVRRRPLEFAILTSRPVAPWAALGAGRSPFGLSPCRRRFITPAVTIQRPA
jgi:hemoglobin